MWFETPIKGHPHSHQTIEMQHLIFLRLKLVLCDAAKGIFWLSLWLNQYRCELYFGQHICLFGLARLHAEIRSFDAVFVAVLFYHLFFILIFLSFQRIYIYFIVYYQLRETYCSAVIVKIFSVNI